MSLLFDAGNQDYFCWYMMIVYIVLIHIDIIDYSCWYMYDRYVSVHKEFVA